MEEIDVKLLYDAWRRILDINYAVINKAPPKSKRGKIIIDSVRVPRAATLVMIMGYLEENQTPLTSFGADVHVLSDVLSMKSNVD
nr:hypothetical protein [Tanacetum cinerariifolium]